MGCHFGNITTLVQTNAYHLEELELDLQCWSRQWENREMRVVRQGERWEKVPASTMLARQIFGLGMDADMDMRFPKMKSLKLTRVPLKDEITGKAVTPACINFSNLTSLTLNMCPHWTTLLTTLTQSKTPLNLKSFEILDFYLQTPHETAIRKTSIITNFLDSLMGLGMDEDELRRIGEDPEMNPLSRLDLQFFGLTCAPKYLVRLPV